MACCRTATRAAQMLWLALAIAAIPGCAVQEAQRVSSTSDSLFEYEAIYDGEPLIHRFMRGEALPEPAFTLMQPGVEAPVDYARFGVFRSTGTPDYQYTIKNHQGLKAAVGEGIYPNQDAILENPVYRELQKSGLMSTRHWDAMKLPDPRAAFFIWAEAQEEEGVKAFFTANALERAGLIMHAIKAYHAVIVHFPKSACWSADGKFVWYVAPAAVANIQRLCNQYPAQGWRYEDGFVRVINGEDTKLENDIVIVRPGRFVSRSVKQRIGELPDLSSMEIVERRGAGRVQAVKYSNGHWQLLVDGRLFMVRGISYSPTEIGYSPSNDSEFHSRWQFTDNNENGLIDAPYEAWVDRNGNGIQDPHEPAVGDFQLLNDMGCNAIRFFIPTKNNEYDPSFINKPLFRDLYERFGISVIASDFLGAYTVGSGASWKDGTDYTNPEQRARMKEVVRQKVLDLKDEPWVLMWLLGNENNMRGDHKGVNATRTNASAHPREYAEFVNEVAQMIHELDPDRLVAIGNLETGLGEFYAKHAPEVDVFGINAYRGANGFGALWREARAQFDRPVLIVEYGCDAYAEGKGPDEAAQAAYHLGCLRDIVLNQGGGELEGNSIGGVIFACVDEWWKAGGDPRTQETNSSWAGPMPDGLAHEEWFGIVGQGRGNNSPFERYLREAYHLYRHYWSSGW